MRILLLCCSIFAAQTAFAEVQEKCQLEVKIDGVGVIQEPTVHFPAYHVYVVGQVLSATNPDGSTTCVNQVGKTEAMNVQSVALMDLVRLKKDDRIRLLYSHIALQTPAGAGGSITFELRSEAQRAYHEAWHSEAFQNAISELRTALAAPTDEPLNVLATQVMALPETRCGFAGCLEVYLLSMTLARSTDLDKNGSITAKVALHKSAKFGSVVEVLKP